MTAKDHLGISLVGCGIISEIQAEAIQKSRNAYLTSVYSRNPENAEKVGTKFNVPWSTDWDSFIQDERVAIVSVCTPSGTHLEYGKLAAEAGKHVVVEKPIEVTLERGQQLIDVCRGEDVKLAVIFQNRFVSDVQRMKRHIDDGDLGAIYLASAYVKWYRDQAYYDSAEWRGTFALDGGGVLINQAIHTIDLLLWMAGDVESVFGQIGTLTHEGIEGEDNAVAALRFKSGALGVIECSTSVRPPQSRRLVIHGSNGTASLTGDTLNLIDASDSSSGLPKMQEPESAPGAQQGFSTEPHQRQFEAIVESIKSNVDPPVSGEEAMKSLSIVRGIYKSAKLMKPMILNEV